MEAFEFTTAEKDIESVLDERSNRLFALSSKLLMKSVDFLVDAGFTRDEAFQFVLKHGATVKPSNDY